MSYSGKHRIYGGRRRRGLANSVLSSLLESMSGPTTRARVWRGLTQTGARARTLAEHRAILDALAAHEPEVARSWATVHIAGVEQWLASVP